MYVMTKKKASYDYWVSYRRNKKNDKKVCVMYVVCRDAIMRERDRQKCEETIKMTKRHMYRM